MPGEQPELKQDLERWQIFFIVISAVIGSGIFNNNGEPLEVAGPAGMLLAIFVIGVIAICVMEGVSEFTQLFPAPNAIVTYVRVFVDKDLAWVVGICYWYSFAAAFAVQNLQAASLSRYWHWSQTAQTIGFYFFAPAVVLAINFIGVRTFGMVESVGGILKIMLVFGCAILMYVIAGERVHEGLGAGAINDGFQGNTAYTKDHNQAVCYAIPLIAYSFLGVETVTVTAFEAKYSRSLRLPSQAIAYVVFVLYFLLALGECLNIKWTTIYLPQISGGASNATEEYSDGSGNLLPSGTTLLSNGTLLYQNGTLSNFSLASHSAVIIAAYRQGYHQLAGFLNACLIFSVLSASNTSLYVSSRTLYGLARDVPRTNIFGKVVHWLSGVVPLTKVPAAALCVSAVSFFWLPFLQIEAEKPLQDLIAIMSISASAACFFVWACLCIAFIRYHWWLKLCDEDLIGDTYHYKRNTTEYKSFTVFAWAQPFPAWLGLIGCILVLFGFTSATWWDTEVTFRKVAAAYAVPVIFVPCWLIFKLVNRRWWVRLDNDAGRLVRELRAIEWLKIADRLEQTVARSEHGKLMTTEVHELRTTTPPDLPELDRVQDSLPQLHLRGWN